MTDKGKPMTDDIHKALADTLASADLVLVQKKDIDSLATLLDCYRDLASEGLRDRRNLKRSVSGHTVANARYALSNIYGEEVPPND